MAGCLGEHVARHGTLMEGRSSACARGRQLSEQRGGGGGEGEGVYGGCGGLVLEMQSQWPAT